jgi:hypothetical protein
VGNSCNKKLIMCTNIIITVQLVELLGPLNSTTITWKLTFIHQLNSIKK